MYKALQKITEREHGFSSDQNVMVLRLVADSLEATEQYGENTQLLLHRFSWMEFYFH